MNNTLPKNRDNLMQQHKSQQVINKAAVARSFGKAAATYDQHAILQRQTSTYLLSLLPDFIKTKSKDKYKKLTNIVDLGCGSGAMLAQLTDYSSHVIAADLSIDMLKQARTAQKAHTWLNLDAEALPFSNNSIDLIVSNLALQWCDDLAVPVQEMMRCIKPGGYALFSTVAEGSLVEISQAWAQVNSDKHVNDFLSATDIKLATSVADESVEILKFQQHTLYYPDVKGVMQSLKGIGANHVQGQAERVTSRAELRQFKINYEALIDQQGLPISYNIAYCLIKKMGCNGIIRNKML